MPCQFLVFPIHPACSALFSLTHSFLRFPLPSTVFPSQLLSSIPARLVLSTSALNGKPSQKLSDMAKFLYFLSLYFGFFNLAHSASPLALVWSSSSFGPDGPWHAVTVKLGSTQQNLNLYPGGEFPSYILNTTQCTSNSGSCYAKSAGSIWNPSISTSFVSGEVSFLSEADFSGEVLDISGTSAPSDSTYTLYSTDEVQINGNSVPNFDIALVSQDLVIGKHSSCSPD